MASEASSSLVLFVAAIAIAALAAAVMAHVVSSMANELRQRGDDMADTMGTDIEIVNDPQNVPWDGTNLTIYVKNVGTTPLKEGELLILVDGEHASYTVSLLDGAESWRPGDVAEYTVDPATDPSGDTRVSVTYEVVSDDLSFRM